MEISGTPDRVMEIQDQKIELHGVTLLHMNEIRKWTNFLAILGFVAVGLLILIGVIMILASIIAASSSFISSSLSFNTLAVLGPWIGIVYIILAGIYFIPVYYLYKFSVLSKHSLLQLNHGQENSNAMMAQAIDYLKKHFRFVGIFTIVILSMYVLIAIGAFFMKAMM